MARSLHRRATANFMAATIMLCTVVSSTAQRSVRGQSSHETPRSSHTSLMPGIGQQIAEAYRLRRHIYLQAEAFAADDRYTANISAQLKSSSTLAAPSFADLSAKGQEFYPTPPARGLGRPLDLIRDKQPWPPYSGVTEQAASGFSFEPPRASAYSRDAMDFAVNFLKGTQNPNRHLESQVKKSGAHSHNASLILSWDRTPQSKRVFVIGSRADYPQIRKLQAYLKKSGLKLFFYLECIPLCSSETVGALFATSGITIHLQSPHALASTYVPLEASLAIALDGQIGSPMQAHDLKVTLYETRALLEGAVMRAQVPMFALDCPHPVSERPACPKTEARVEANR